MAIPLADIGSILGGLGGLFGKKQKNPTPAQNMMSQAQGAREAAAAYGFNPLTMLQYGQPGGTGLANSSTPPLASVQMLVDGLTSVDDVVSGDAARRRAADELNLDLQRRQLQRAVSEGPSVAHARDAVGRGPSPLGSNSVDVTGRILADSAAEYGPQPLVNVFNPMLNGWQGLHPGLARRLDLKNGDAIMAEDYEAIVGDVGSEFINLPATASEVLGFGNGLPRSPLFRAPPSAFGMGSPAKTAPRIQRKKYVPNQKVK